MVTFAFFLVAVAHTGLIILGTPFFLIGDLFVGISGAFNGDSKDSRNNKLPDYLVLTRGWIS